MKSFTDAREQLMQVLYNAISYISGFVIRYGNVRKLDNKIWRFFDFDKNDVIIVPIYNGTAGEYENLYLSGLAECEGALYAVGEDGDFYSLTEEDTEILRFAAVWNIIDNLNTYYD